MSTRVGIDLTASRCAVVAASPTEGAEVRVRAFQSIAYSQSDRSELKGALTQLVTSGAFAPHAHVVLWGVRNLCLTLPVTDDQVDLQARAFEAAHAAVADFGAWADEAWVHLAVSGRRSQGPREALFIAASGSDIRKRLRVVERAGFAVDGVSTPAIALAALSRFRRSPGPDSVTAYVALNREAGCVAIVAGGRLVYSRDLSWTPGFDRPESPRQLLERYVFVSRVAPELRRIFDQVRRTLGCEVDQIVTCGDLPELRSLTMPLIEELDLEVETLDSMEGIDVRALPEPRDQFREQIASLRLAWVVAASQPSIELAPVASRRLARRRAWVTGGVAAAAAVTVAVALWPSPDEAQRVDTSRQAPPARSATGDRGRQVNSEARERAAATASTSERSDASAAALEPLRTRNLTGQVEFQGSQVTAAGRPLDLADTRSAQPPSSAALESSTDVARPFDGAQDRPVHAEGARETAAPVSAAVRDSGRRAEPSVSSDQRPLRDVDQRSTGRQESDAPAGGSSREVADPIVKSILYASDRRLAVVDGRVVGVGDSIPSGVVIDISRDAIVVRARSGAERRFGLRSSSGSD